MDTRRLQSLRCLFASVASLEIMELLLKSKRLHHLADDGDDIEDVLLNIRAFFIAGLGLSREEVSKRHAPMGGFLSKHIHGVLFLDAIRWWAAAHRTGQDENKYLRTTMYSGEFAGLCDHFYHEFRNNQLAHFNEKLKTNDLPFLTPAPYGFSLTWKEYGDFRSLLSHSIQLTLVEGKLETMEELLLALPEYGQLSEAGTQELMDTAHKVMQWQSEAFLKIPTRNRFPESEALA